MPTKPVTTIATVGSQRDRRYLDTFYDQHKHPVKAPEGRPWHGYREFAANQGDRDGFVGSLRPGRHATTDEHGNLTERAEAAWATVWSAPWMPEDRFFEFNYTRNTMAIRYDRIIAHDTKGFDNHYEAAAKIAHNNSWTEVLYGGPLRRGISAIIGDWPQSPKIAQAGQAGDPWILGFTDEVNTELAQLLGMSKHGIPMRVEREPLLPAEAILSVPQDELAAMIADAVAKAMAGRDQEDAKRKEAQRQSMANARGARKNKSTSDTLPRAS